MKHYDSERQRFTPKMERARIARVVEELGLLNDRVNACLAAADHGGLLAVAAEYAARNMPRKANDVLELVPTGAAVVGVESEAR